MEIVTAKTLIAAGTPPNWMETSDQPALILDIGHPPEASERPVLEAWLDQQPLPTIGIGKAGTPLDDHLDLIVSSESEGESLLQRITDHPEAAAILVQVTRQTGHGALPNALVLESLGYAALQSGHDHRRWLASRTPPQATPVNTPVICQRDGDCLNIQLNSPGNRNALSMAMRDALAEAFQLALIDPEINNVSVSGAGPDFCAGGDLKEFGLADDPARSHRVRQQRMPGQFVGMAPEKFHFHLHGACIGAGIEIPAFAGRVTANADTLFRLPELDFGLIPGAGGCVSVTRRIGRHRTNALVIKGETIDAATALEWGLIDGMT